jgi:hypothetical protein
LATYLAVIARRIVVRRIMAIGIEPVVASTMTSLRKAKPEPEPADVPKPVAIRAGTKQAQIIARAIGGRGPNRDYLFNTAAHLRKLGLADADLDWLARRVAELA